MNQIWKMFHLVFVKKNPFRGAFKGGWGGPFALPLEDILPPLKLWQNYDFHKYMYYAVSYVLTVLTISLRIHLKWALSLYICKIFMGEHAPIPPRFVHSPPSVPDIHICPLFRNILNTALRLSKTVIFRPVYSSCWCLVQHKLPKQPKVYMRFSRRDLGEWKYNFGPGLIIVEKYVIRILMWYY